jgi:hypothetical protein
MRVQIFSTTYYSPRGTGELWIGNELRWKRERQDSGSLVARKSDGWDVQVAELCLLMCCWDFPETATMVLYPPGTRGDFCFFVYLFFVSGFGFLVLGF